jgi:two-component system, OmpR family, response regulator
MTRLPEENMETREVQDPSIDLAGITEQEPEVSSEDARSFSNAAMIGGEKLRASGFFVNIVRQAPRAAMTDRAPLALIVEDDPGTVMVIKAVLEKEGYQTRSAGNLGEIIRALSTRPHPDLILLDIMLPDANGFAVLERLRRHPELSGTPVIMLTSLSQPADVAKGLALGANGYMSKPARPQALLSAIKAVLGLEVE